jgi:hypothetical protein
VLIVIIDNSFRSFQNLRHERSSITASTTSLIQSIHFKYFSAYRRAAALLRLEEAI